MVGRYPYVEPSRCTNREVGEKQMQDLLGRGGVRRFVCLQGELPPQEQMPVGGAETGVTQESTNNTSALALGGGLALMAAAGGTYVVRRRTAQA